jgi:anti-anti-sigma factor
MPPILNKREQDVLVLYVLKAFMQDRGMREFEACYLPAIASDKKLVMDMTELDYIDSSHLAALVTFFKKVGEAGGRVVFCGLKPAVRDTFIITRLDRIFPIAATRKEAVDLLGDKPSA